MTARRITFPNPDHKGRLVDTDTSPAMRWGCLSTVICLVFGILAWFQTTSTDPGFVAVIRNGGALDNKTIRQIVPPASGLTWTGWWSTEHDYPTTERFTNIIPGEFGADPSKGDTADADAYRTDTKDGVNVGVVGQIKFVLNTADDPNAPDDPQRSPLRAFDTGYGQRTYADPVSGDRRAVWDGDEGFATFLAGQVRPVYQETIRQVLGDRSCVELAASCALLRQGAQGSDPQAAAAAAAALANAPSNSQVFQAVSDEVSKQLAAKVNASLGGPFLTDIRFTLTAIDLPPNVRAAIEKAQVAFAATAEANGRAATAVAEAQGRVSTAQADAQANKVKQDGYNSCPTCADLDRIRAQGDALSHLPAGVTVYAPGNGNVQVPVR